MELLNYFNGDELAATAWASKYAATGEVTPADMHRRLAKELAAADSKYEPGDKVTRLALSEFGQTIENLSEEKIFSYLDKFKWIVPQGSIMAMLGNKDKIGSLSNCFVTPPPYDSYGGIMHSDQELVQLMKRRGGNGLHLSTLRYSGSLVKNAAGTSSGVVNFAERFSNSTREVAQDGRRGALMLLLHVKHPDIFQWVTMKQDLKKVTGANVSSMLTHEYMAAVEEDKDFICTFPCDYRHDGTGVDNYNELVEFDDKIFGKVGVMRIKARELFDLIVEMAWKNGEPGVAFIDTVKDYCPEGVYPELEPVASNPCQPEFATILTRDGVKTLGEINIGDEIWSKEGWTKVINKWSNGVKSVYNVYTTGGVFVGTLNHKVDTPDGKKEIKDADSILTISGEAAKIQELDSQIVMDGLFFGDGYYKKGIRSNGHPYLYPVLSVGHNDRDYFKSEISDLVGNKFYKKSEMVTEYRVKTTISESEKVRSYDLSIPERYYLKDNMTTCSFLRGLYSADGSAVSAKKGVRVTYKTASKTLSRQVQQMLSSVGIRSYVTINKSKKVNFDNGEYTCKESYDVNITKDIKLFFDLIGFIQDYKNQKIEDYDHIPANRETYTSKTEVEYVGEHEVFDITVDNQSHTYWTGGLSVSNCGEQWMQPYDACRLLAVNLFSCVVDPFKHGAHIDFEKLYEICYIQQRLADNIVDLELSYINKIINKINSDPEPDYIKNNEVSLWRKVRDSCINSRRTGCGFTALADTFAALNLGYSNSMVLEDIMRTKMRAELDCMIDMAIQRGSFPLYDRDLEWDYANNKLTGKNSFYKMLGEEFPYLSKKMYLYGRRNSNWSTVAPTGTVSIVTQTSSGLEPLFQPFYIRRRKINPSDRDSRVDFTDQNGDNWQEYPVIHPKFKDWIDLNSDDKELDKSKLEELFTKSPWYKATANDIDWQQRIDIQSTIQKYTSNAISSTINLPKDVDKSVVYSIYKAAWKAGLKGVTVYRDGSRSGVLINKNSFEYRDAVKRPAEIPGNLHVITVKGIKYAVIIGLMDHKPYEIFGFLLPPEIKKDCVGVVRKVSKGHYDFVCDDVLIKDIHSTGVRHDEQVLTRLGSGMLRHGAKPQFVMEQIERCELEVVSFGKAVSRVLKKYISESELVSRSRCSECKSINLRMQEGCLTCNDCGSSKCG